MICTKIPDLSSFTQSLSDSLTQGERVLVDLSSIGALNAAFTRWVEDEYHVREHSSLKMKPIDRFGLDLRRIRYLPPSEANDELFFVEQERTVLKDNTFSLMASALKRRGTCARARWVSVSIATSGKWPVRLGSSYSTRASAWERRVR